MMESIMSLSIVILAAGKGTRMKSAQAKVMHGLAGRPLLQHVIDTAKELKPLRLTVVAGNGAEQVLPFLKGNDVDAVMQTEQLGTGHAVMQAKAAMVNAAQVLILYGDVPLIQATTLRALVNCAADGGIGILTTQPVMAVLFETVRVK
jgi:bifunctional UDP-N-acetylglucosamine pyrophosphorylase/glucosamine-1-phosphate N-acetyltransferase